MKNLIICSYLENIFLIKTANPCLPIDQLNKESLAKDNNIYIKNTSIKKEAI